jgi:hypothetical protein
MPTIRALSPGRRAPRSSTASHGVGSLGRSDELSAFRSSPDYVDIARDDRIGCALSHSSVELSFERTEPQPTGHGTVSSHQRDS